jgi:flagellar protein FliO/FliZ
MQFLSSAFGDRALLVLGVILALIVVAGFGVMLARAFGDRNGRAFGGRGRQQRLGVVDAFDLDRQRQLVIIRRDNVEHLVMIGGPNDVVIESAIVRQAASTGRQEPYAASLGAPRPATAALEGRPDFEAPAEEPVLPIAPGGGPTSTPPAGPRFPFPPNRAAPQPVPPRQIREAPRPAPQAVSPSPQPPAPTPTLTPTPAPAPVQLREAVASGARLRDVSAVPPPPSPPEPDPAVQAPPASQPTPQPASQPTPQPAAQSTPPAPPPDVPPAPPTPRFQPRPGATVRPTRSFPTLRPGAGPLFPVRAAPSADPKPAPDLAAASPPTSPPPPSPPAAAEQKPNVLEAFESLEEEMAKLLGRPTSGETDAPGGVEE